MFSNKLFQNYSRQCIQHYPASETAQCSMLCSLLWPVDIFVWKTKKYQGVKDMLCVFYMQNNSWEYIKGKIVSMVMIQRYESMILYFQEIQKMRKLKRSKHADSMIFWIRPQGSTAASEQSPVACFWILMKPQVPGKVAQSRGRVLFHCGSSKQNRSRHSSTAR